jgi:hypothetical protein
VPLTRSLDYKSLVVFVTADFAVRHKSPLSRPWARCGAFSNNVLH